MVEGLMQNCVGCDCLYKRRDNNGMDELFKTFYCNYKGHLTWWLTGWTDYWEDDPIKIETPFWCPRNHENDPPSPTIHVI
jgi:hypothetical protein